MKYLYSAITLTVLLFSSAQTVSGQAVMGGSCTLNASLIDQSENSQCPSRSSCKNSKVSAVGDGVCTHKHLDPVDGLDIATICAVFVASALAAGGGIGGGGLLVPIYIILEGFAAVQATALSLATIGGSSLANLWLYARRRHPDTSRPRPLIDYESALLLTPSLLAGTTIGVTLSTVVPEWLVVVLLIAALGSVSHKTLKKGIAKWTAQQKANAATNKEIAEMEATLELPSAKTALHAKNYLPSKSPSDIEMAKSPTSSAISSNARLPGSKDLSAQRPSSLSNRDSLKVDIADGQSALNLIYARDSKLLPVVPLAYTFGLWVLAFAFALLRGGRGGASIVGAECGDELFWWLLFANMAALVAASWALRHRLLRKNLLLDKLGHQPFPGDLVWDPSTTIWYPLISLAAGVGAGLLGLGGGMVVGPLLLALNNLPAQVTATSAWIVLITATSGLAQVLLYGLVPFDYAALFSFVGLVSTFLGQTVVEYLIKKYKQDSVVILVIGVVMVVAMILMALVGIMNIINGAPSSFSPLCG